MNVHLLVNELCEYQNARCNNMKKKIKLYFSVSHDTTVSHCNPDYTSCGLLSMNA